jgi:galactose mutarotase-like enzyme
MDALVRRGEFGGADAWILENETVKAVCLPAHGGKLASLYCKEKKFELLFQNPFGSFRKACPGSDFSAFEACGFDDAFPNIDAGVVQTEQGDREYFDHGEIWTAEFSCEPCEKGIALHYRSPFLGYSYQKTLSLQKSTLTVGYFIQNESGAAFPCIWACHCLVNYRGDMRVIFPEGTNRVMNVMDTEILGSTGQIYQFPRDEAACGGIYDFTSVPRADSKTMLKYYCCATVKEGRCGYRYPSDGIEVSLRYDGGILPYLGFWVTAGGYRGDRNCALEPTNGFYDSIATAQKNGKCPVLEPNGEMAFELGISFDTV